MRKVSFFIIFFQMLTVPLFAGGWYSVNIDLKTTAAMTAAYAAETATEMMNGEGVQKILDHYTNAEVSTAGIFASKCQRFWMLQHLLSGTHRRPSIGDHICFPPVSR